MELKQEVFRDLEKHCRPDALLLSNTSGLNIDDIAAVLKDPSRVMGCHFFSPANVMQLLENIMTTKSSEKTLSTGMAMGKLIGKKNSYGWQLRWIRWKPDDRSVRRRGQNAF